MAKKAKAQAEIDINAVKDGAEARTNLLKKGNVEYYLAPTTNPPYCLHTWYSEIDLFYSKPYTLVADIEFKGATYGSRIMPYIRATSYFAPSIFGAGDGYKGIYVGRNILNARLDATDQLMFYAIDSQGGLLDGKRPLGELKVKWICLYEGHLDNPPLTYMPSKSDLSPLVKMVGTKIQIDDQPAVELKGEKGDKPVLSMTTDHKLKADGEVISEVLKGEKGDKPVVSISAAHKLLVDGVEHGSSLKGEQGIQGYTFRCRDDHAHYPTSQYRWDDEFRDWVTREVNGQVEAYQVKQRGNVPNGTSITNTTWWERNDAHLHKISANNVVGDLSAFKVRSVATVVDSQAKYDNLCRALSGGTNSYNWDLETNVIIVSTYASRTFLPHPSAFRNKSLKIIRWHGWDNYIPASYRGYFYIYQKTSLENIPVYTTKGSYSISIMSEYSGFYKMTVLLSYDVGPETVLTNLDNGGTAIYEFFSDGANWYWQNSREFSTAFREVVSQNEKAELKAAADWVNRVSSAKKSPRLAALIIEGTYTTANSYIIDGQYGYIEWEGDSGRNGIGLADSLPVGFTCEVQNNSTLYDLTISGTVLTNISYVPKRTIVRIRKLQSGLLVTLVASLSATVTSKI